MADFIETSNTKTATRELASPVADAATVRVCSYQNDAILSAVEAWADTVAALA